MVNGLLGVSPEYVKSKTKKVEKVFSGMFGGKPTIPYVASEKEITPELASMHAEHFEGLKGRVPIGQYIEFLKKAYGDQSSKINTNSPFYIAELTRVNPSDCPQIDENWFLKTRIEATENFI